MESCPVCVLQLQKDTACLFIFDANRKHCGTREKTKKKLYLIFQSLFLWIPLEIVKLLLFSSDSSYVYEDYIRRKRFYTGRWCCVYYKVRYTLKCIAAFND